MEPSRMTKYKEFEEMGRLSGVIHDTIRYRFLIEDLHAKLSRMDRYIYREITGKDIPIGRLLPRRPEMMRRYILYLTGIEVETYHTTTASYRGMGIERREVFARGKVVRYVIHDTIRYRFLILDAYEGYHRTSFQVHYRDRVCSCKSIP